MKKLAHRVIFTSTIAAAILLSGCGGGAIPQDATPDTTNTQQTQTTQQAGAPTTLGGTPSSNWSLHMTAKKLFPGNPDTTVNKYCKTVVGNMNQCQLYDGNDGDSRLVGVETIVGPEMYGNFTNDEKKLWMPTKDLMLATQTTMPELDAQQFDNAAQSFSNKYSKIYLLWDPGKINIPTGSPLVTVINTTAAAGASPTITTGTTLTAAPTTAGATTTASATTANTSTAPTTTGGFTFATFDIAKLITAGLTDKKGNFETSILQRNQVGSLELYKLKDRIGLHQYANTSHVMFIISGKGEFTIGDKKVPVSGGMVVLLPAGTPHAFKNLGGKDSPLVFVTFKTPYDENDAVKWME